MSGDAPREPMSTTPADGSNKSYLRGTHRTRHPRDTVLSLRPLLARVGITRIANVTGLDVVGVPVVVAVRPNARSLSTSQGKGLDLDAAQASAILEATEQYHAERPELSLVRGSFHEVCELRRVCRVDRLPRYVRPFVAHEPTLWVEARDVLTSAARLVPFDLVHLDLRYPPRHSTGWFPLGSNGLASGNSRTEALAHALWELIERDATALFFAMNAEEQRLRRLDLNSVRDEIPRGLLARIADAGLELAVWDITSDLGLPAFCAIIVESTRECFRVVGQARGYGCHNDRSVAFCRAVTEAAQSRLTRIVGSRDDMDLEGFRSLRTHESITSGLQLVSRATGTPREFSDVPSWTFETFEEDLDLILRRLECCGMDEVLVVDLSRSGFPVSVVRAIVPGLEGAPEAVGYQPGERVRKRQEVAS